MLSLERDMYNLPDFCFALTPCGDKVVLIIKGMRGYYPISTPDKVDFKELNDILGVTEPEVNCMLIGSMFGFDAPGANPKVIKQQINNKCDDTEPKKYEVLFNYILDNNFGDWSKCEGHWIEKTQSEIKNIIKALSKAMPSLTEENDWFCWESQVLQQELNNGKCVEFPCMKARLITNKPKCPTCGNSYDDTTRALSRRYGETDVCSDCGYREAMEDYKGYR